MYRCEVTTVAGFVQQLAVSYLVHGYWFYVTGRIPKHKDPRRVDEKLIARYGIDLSKWSRARRKQAAAGLCALNLPTLDDWSAWKRQYEATKASCGTSPETLPGT